MIALALVLLAAQAERPTREERVLELVERAYRGKIWHYTRARYVQTAAPLGTGTVLEPRVALFCGNSDYGTFDDGRARALARELFEIYGLQVQRDHLLHDDGRSVLLDGLVREPKLAFKLRGRGELAMGSDGLPEHEQTALDEDELSWLEAQGYAVYVSDVGLHRNWDGDEFASMLAWMSGVVGFLNAGTEGEDVDLGGLLFEREATWEWPVDAAVARVPDVQIADRMDGELAYTFDLLVRRPSTLVMPCAGLADLGAPPRLSFFLPEIDRMARPIGGSTRSAPSVLLFRAGAHALPDSASRARPDLRLRIRQSNEGRELTHESRTFTLFLPGEFDLAEPFVLEMDLAPGRYSFHGPARLGAAARD